MLFFFIVTLACAQNDGPLVETPSGPIRGLWSSTRDGKDMAIFRSMPYAQPPVSKAIVNFAKMVLRLES